MERARGGRVAEALHGLREAIIAYHAGLEERRMGINTGPVAEPPEAWLLYKECRFWGVLPVDGALLDQPWLIMQEFRVCNAEEARIEKDRQSVEASRAVPPVKP